MHVNDTIAPQALAQLQSRPRHYLGYLPTPLVPLPRITAHCGGPQIWIKRDDCTGLATGGNKTRKLEYLLGDALAQGCDTLVSVGALQSNHARQVAAAGATAGLKVHLVLTDSVPGRGADYAVLGNIQLCRLLGAQIHRIDGNADVPAACEAVVAQLRDRGAKPYFIPMGGSNGMGSLGYVNAFTELHQQMQEKQANLDAVVLASGSGGTQAGLMLGAALAQWQGRIHGVSVGPTLDVVTQRIRSAASDAAALLGVASEAVAALPLHMDLDCKGPHYGIPDAQTYKAVELAAQLEGVVLDPVYSGKGFAGLLKACSKGGELHSAQHVVFVHTGGAAALSAYPEVGNTPAALD